MLTLDVKTNFKSLDKLKQRLANPQPLFQRLDKRVTETVVQQLQSNANVGRWQPLSPRYARQKLARYGPKPILLRKDVMLKIYARGGKYAGVKYTFGPDVPLAIWHHMGTSQMPARPLDYKFVPALAKEELQRFVKEAVQAAGL